MNEPFDSTRVSFTITEKEIIDALNDPMIKDTGIDSLVNNLEKMKIWTSKEDQNEFFFKFAKYLCFKYGIRRNEYFYINKYSGFPNEEPFNTLRKKYHGRMFENQNLKEKKDGKGDINIL